MNGIAPAAASGAPRSRVGVELGLLALVVLSLALVPVRIGDVWNGLPAHPLLVHVPVVLIPMAALIAVAGVVRRGLLARVALPLAALVVIALVGTMLAYGAGQALRSARYGTGQGAAGQGAFPGRAGLAGERSLIAEHANAAGLLRIVVILFAVAAVLAAIAERVHGDSDERGPLDGLVASRAALVVTRGALVVVAVVATASLVRTGDLGARAVWQERGRGGLPGGQFPGFGAGGGQLPSRTGQGGGAPPPGTAP